MRPLKVASVVNIRRALIKFTLFVLSVCSQSFLEQLILFVVEGVVSVVSSFVFEVCIIAMRRAHRRPRIWDPAVCDLLRNLRWVDVRRRIGGVVDQHGSWQILVDFGRS